jgi:hypothetical protein
MNVAPAMIVVIRALDDLSDEGKFFGSGEPTARCARRHTFETERSRARDERESVRVLHVELKVSGWGQPRSGRADERIEQWGELSRPPEILRVPLHADAERGIRFLDPLDDLVVSDRRCDESLAQPADRLVVPAVDAAGIRHDRGPERPFEM